MGCAPTRLTKISSSKKNAQAKSLSILPGTFRQINDREFTQVYSIGRSLGAGTFGEVMFCTHIKTNSRRAVKVFQKESLTSDFNKLKFENEINILKVLDHPNIVRVYEFFEDVKKFYIVMEHCRGGELFQEIMKMKKYDELQSAQIMRQLFSCVSYLHSKNICHRDLKPENILFDEKSDYMGLKLIDFGSACFFNEKHMKEGMGTAYYIAPEVLKNNYTEKCDVWSAGVILFILLTGAPPFSGDNNKEIFKSVLKGSYNKDVLLKISPSNELMDLISNLLVVEKFRFSATEALDHPWFKNNTSSTVDQAVLSKTFNNLSHFETNNVLKDAVRTFIATQLMTVEEIKQAKEIFKALDANGDGKLSKEELITGYSGIMSEDDAIKHVERIMSQVDTDNNGYIEYSEFLKAAVDKDSMMCKKNMKHAFELFDKDGNGKISAVELKEVLQGNEPIDESVWQQVVTQLDVNGDGEIDLAEFEAFLNGTD